MISVQQAFFLDTPVSEKMKKSVNHRARRVARKHDDNERHEFDPVLKAEILTPAVSSWLFTVLIETKKDGKRRVVL